jgi:hypothetical protein
MLRKPAAAGQMFLLNEVSGLGLASIAWDWAEKMVVGTVLGADLSMKIWILVIVLSGMGVALGAPKQGVPVTISSDEEIASHQIGDPPFVRVEASPDQEAGAQRWLSMHVRVDPEGSVLLATGEQDVPSNVRLTAEAVARATKYRPFERGGHAIEVEFDCRVAVFPPERQPSRRVPFPAVSDWDSVRVKLSRTRCYGACPAYSVEIHGDGTVLYKGEAFVAVTGDKAGSISKEAVRQLVAEFRNVDYYSLGDYSAGAFDVPTVETSIDIDGHTKKVIDQDGLWLGMPISVRKLEFKIDEIAGTKQWVEGSR